MPADATFTGGGVLERLVGDLCAALGLAAGGSGSVPNNCIALLLRYDQGINRVGTANRYSVAYRETQKARKSGLFVTVTSLP